MFDGRKFIKNYPLLTEFIIDINQRKELAKDKNFFEYYNINKKNIETIIRLTKEIYPIEKVKEIVNEIIIKKQKCSIETFSFNIVQLVGACKKINDNIEPVKNLEEERIINNGNKCYYEEALKYVYKISFLYYIKDINKILKLNGEDIYEIFKNSYIDRIKIFLFTLAKNKRIEFFVEEINKCSKEQYFIKSLFNNVDINTDLILFDEKIKNDLGQEYYTRLLFYYYDGYSSNKIGRERIRKLISLNKFDLIKDILLFNRRDILDKVSIHEDSDIFNIEIFNSSDISRILERKILGDKSFNWNYYLSLKVSLGIEKYNKFISKYKEIVDLLVSIYKTNLELLSKEEQRKIYNYINTLNDSKLKEIREEIEIINKEMEEMYKTNYTDKINEANTIIEKAVLTEIEDSNQEKHSIKIYELKEEEKFRLLITVMNKRARLMTTNMYNRPLHVTTINDPSKFNEDLPNGSEIISTSMIDNTHVDTFVGPYVDVMYVFSDLEPEDIIGIAPCDAAFPPKIEENQALFPRDIALTPEELMHKTKYGNGNIVGHYNEIAIRRKRNNKKIQPTAILCFDEINDISIKHAEYFNVPIIILNTKTYRNFNTFTDELEKNKKESLSL